MDSGLATTTTVEATAAATAMMVATVEEASLNIATRTADRENKPTRPGCYFCECWHKYKNCTSRLDSAAAPAADGCMHGRYIGATQSSISL